MVIVLKIVDRNRVRDIALLCSFIYFISYVTRINYGAVISEMVSDTGLPKSALSIALTGNFIAYGIGQLISGYFGDKFQPKHLISLGLITTITMNSLIPVCDTNLQRTVVWCINGLAQAFMWPPMVKLTSELMSREDYDHTCVVVSRGSSFGTIFVYLAAPLAIMCFSWKGVFWISAAMAMIGLVIWNIKAPLIEMHPGKAPDDEKNSEDQIASNAGRWVFVLLILSVMIGIVLHGIIRDGVTTWMPSFISENYNLSNEISILTGVLLPIFSILCYQAALWLYSKKIKNPFLCAGIIFAVGAASAAILYFASSLNAVLSVLLMTTLTGCMHGINMLLICIVPPLLSNGGKVSAMSGVLNACTYIGSALSTYVIPLATESSGWSATLLIWLAAAVIGGGICIICIPMWARRSITK